MGQNPIVAVTAALVLIGAVIFTIRNLVGNDSPPTTYSNWYNMKTDTLYGSDANDVAPVTLPSGAEAVKAAVFANGSCDDTKKRFIGYLSKFTAETKVKFEEAQQQDPIDPMRMKAISDEGQMIKRPDDADWVEGNSNAGFAILDEYNVPFNTDPKPCPYFLK
jgi:hypothetical protein